MNSELRNYKWWPTLKANLARHEILRRWITEETETVHIFTAVVRGVH